MSRQAGGERCTGPYAERAKWRVKFFTRDGDFSRFYSSRSEAEKAIEDFRKGLKDEQQTIDWALMHYERHMRAQGNKPRSIETTFYRLRAMLDVHAPLSALTTSKAQRWFDAYRTTPTRMGRCPSIDTQRNTLGQARTFGAWCVGRRWLKANPWANVKALGKRRAGKKQLVPSEARLLQERCLTEQSAGAAGVLAALWLGLRASEILGLEPRDLDGELLYVWEGKTDNAARVLVCPAELRELLLPHLPYTSEQDRHWLLRECKRLCKAAGIPVVTLHGLRGTHATIARGPGGATAALVAGALGHGGTAVTERHYIDGQAAAQADQRQVLRVLQGGQR